MQLWDDVLYPSFRQFIRGEYYGAITRDQLDEECYALTVRAIDTFKFPRISTNYTTFYAVRDQDNPNILVKAEEEDDGAIAHGQFLQDLTSKELNILLAWMKFYWAEMQISNADNFEEQYTDSNIKQQSRGNAVDKNIKLMNQYRNYARDLETRYGRVSVTRTPTIGDINTDD